MLCCLVYCLCLSLELGGGNLSLLLLSCYAFMHLCFDMCCVVLCIVYVYPPELGSGNLRLLLLNLYAFMFVCLDMICVVLSIAYVYPQSLDVEIVVFCC